MTGFFACDLMNPTGPSFAEQGKTWGPWTFDPEERELTYIEPDGGESPGYRYDITLREDFDALRWIDHIAGKRWGRVIDTLGNLVLAFEDLGVLLATGGDGSEEALKHWNAPSFDEAADSTVPKEWAIA
jgi:hypothetical protein